MHGNLANTKPKLGRAKQKLHQGEDTLCYPSPSTAAAALRYQLCTVQHARQQASKHTRRLGTNFCSVFLQTRDPWYEYGRRCIYIPEGHTNQDPFTCTKTFTSIFQHFQPRIFGSDYYSMYVLPRKQILSWRSSPQKAVFDDVPPLSPEEQREF